MLLTLVPIKPILINQMVAAIFNKFTITTTLYDITFAITFSTSTGRNSIDPKKEEEERETVDSFSLFHTYFLPSLPVS